MDPKKAVIAILAVGSAIRELGSVPSGHLYARLAGTLTIDAYNGIIGNLKKAGLVEETNHVLTYIGP